MKSKNIRLLLVLAVLAVLPGISVAQAKMQIQPTNLAQMTQGAVNIVQVVCTGTRESALITGAMAIAVDEYTFTVEDSLKGTYEPGATMLVKQMANKKVCCETSGPSPEELKARGVEGKKLFFMNGVPGYEQGKKYLLFLPPEKSDGLIAPMGVHQGLFAITETESVPMAVNQDNNSMTLMGVDLAGLGEAGKKAGPYAAGGPIPLDVMKELVGTLLDK